VDENITQIFTKYRHEVPLTMPIPISMLVRGLGAIPGLEKLGIQHLVLQQEVHLHKHIAVLVLHKLEEASLAATDLERHSTHSEDLDTRVPMLQEHIDQVRPCFPSPAILGSVVDYALAVQHLECDHGSLAVDSREPHRLPPG
jgi:hypothetical protein